ncbi:hypothetical protein CDCA_CDCA07G2261 [Cyanidium caldarium]|uniref:DUF3727 domain-containing protein n=1 Tax=Cyanidium caldarium TaxID=2771 RepID=A0AAV9IVV5_CYACA|nr:hypothetical protein CDCA_CDCA07G2261 [Cyanidium caldarium]
MAPGESTLRASAQWIRSVGRHGNHTGSDLRTSWRGDWVAWAVAPVARLWSAASLSVARLRPAVAPNGSMRPASTATRTIFPRARLDRPSSLARPSSRTGWNEGSAVAAPRTIGWRSWSAKAPRNGRKRRPPTEREQPEPPPPSGNASSASAAFRTTASTSRSGGGNAAATNGDYDNDDDPDALSADVDADDAPTITLTDPTEPSDRTLDCYVDEVVTVDDQEYMVLMPVNQPVVFAHFVQRNGESLLAAVEEPAEVDRLFRDAFIALADRDVILNRSAVVMTVEGDLYGEAGEDEEEEEDDEDDEEQLDVRADADGEAALGGDSAEEEVEVLATFMDEHADTYYVCMPLEPVVLIGKRVGEDPQHAVLPNEAERARVGPLIEEVLRKRRT